MTRTLVIAGALLLSTPALADAADGGVEKRLLDEQVQKAQSVMAQLGGELRDELPTDWKKPGPLQLERWQWAGIPLLGVFIAALTLLLVRLTRRFIARLTALQGGANPDSGARGFATSIAHVLTQLEGPLRLGWSSLLARITLPVLGLSDATEGDWVRLFRVVFLVSVFWGAWRAVGAWTESFNTSSYALQHPGTRSLVSLLTRLVRLALVAFAILAGLSEVGYSVTSVLAGLGIGGIALALGAQKTLENVFGAFALAVDQPIREGDVVRIGDLVGTVESIGLRSTRIRTIERTVVSIPNGKLADLQLETLAARDRLRVFQRFSLELGTTAEQLAAVRAGCLELLKEHPKQFPGSAWVNVVALGPASIDVELSVHLTTTDWDEFRALRDTLLVELLAAVGAAGAKLAFPTSTVHLREAQPAK